MKKMIIVVFFIWITSIAYGQEAELLKTSSGKVWVVSYGLFGKYEGQSYVNITRPLYRNPQYLTLANKDHKEIVNKVLSYYKTSVGDTFFITFGGSRQYSNYTHDYYFVCEIKSNGSYDYWLWYDL